MNHWCLYIVHLWAHLASRFSSWANILANQTSFGGSVFLCTLMWGREHWGCHQHSCPPSWWWQSKVEQSTRVIMVEHAEYFHRYPWVLQLQSRKLADILTDADKQVSTGLPTFRWVGVCGENDLTVNIALCRKTSFICCSKFTPSLIHAALVFMKPTSLLYNKFSPFTAILCSEVSLFPPFSLYMIKIIWFKKFKLHLLINKLMGTTLEREINKMFSILDGRSR